MKNILIYILLLLTLIACEKSKDIGSVNSGLESKAIAFSVMVSDNSTTRAEAELLRTASEVGSVGLYVYVKRPNGAIEILGENIKLNYVEGKSVWEYDDANSAPIWGYTDGSDRYTFYSYAPYRADGKGISFDADNGEFSLEYSMSDNEDLMIAKTSDIVCPAGGVVTLNLKHTLSALSLNTTYSSVITNVELVTSDSYYTYMPIKGEVSIDDNGKVEWNILEYLTDAERYVMSNESRSYILLLPQTTKSKGDLFFSITSIANGKVVVDENAKIPMMALASSGIYKFNYKEPYFDLDDNGDLVVDLDAFYELKNNGGLESWNDYTAIDEMIEKLKEAGHSTAHIVGKPEDISDAYHIISHIIQNGGMENYNLSGYILPDNATLPYNLFQNNKSIKNIVMPILKEGQMQDNSFWGCTSLESVVFPEGQGLTTFPNATFKGCTSLTSVKLDITSNDLIKIGQSAFEGCVSLKNMEIPSSVEHIGYGAFSGCTLLSKINIPAPVAKIDGEAFLNCTSLYSYGENSGIVFDVRSAQHTPITVGWHGFFNTHVRYNDIPDGYINSETSGNGYFSEP